MKQKWMLPIYCALLAAIAVAAVLLGGAGFLPAAYYTAMAEASVLDFSHAEAIEIPAEELAASGAVDVLLDGMPICAVLDENTAAAVLNARLNAYAQAPQGETLVSVRFSRGITLAPCTGEYTPLTGEDFAALLEENPALCPVERITRLTVETPVPYETVKAEQEDERLPEGARLVDGGSAGFHRRVTEITSINGGETGRNVVEDREILAPVAQLVTLGEYESSRPDREPGRSEGEEGPKVSFILADPLEKADMESYFGTRKGRMHYGVDYDCDPGDPVLAPAAGTVIFAGERGAYGGVVDIDHGEGLVCRLARLSDITVAVGDTLAQGQQIALVMEPDTAEEEPRLHMEVLIGGIPYNPRQYLD